MHLFLPFRVNNAWHWAFLPRRYGFASPDAVMRGRRKEVESHWEKEEFHMDGGQSLSPSPGSVRHGEREGKRGITRLYLPLMPLCHPPAAPSAQ